MTPLAAMSPRVRWETLRAIVTIARMGFRAEPRTALLAAVLLQIDFASGALVALALKALTDAVLAQDARWLLAAAVALPLSLAMIRVASMGGYAARVRLAERAASLMQRHLGELTAAIPTIEHFERPDYLKEMDLLRSDGGGALAQMFGELAYNVSQLGRLLLTVGLLATLHPLLILLPLCGVPSLFLNARAQRIRQRLSEAVAEKRRLEAHFCRICWTEEPAKEMRIFGLGDEIVRRHIAVRAEIDRIEDREQFKATLVTALGWLIFSVGMALAVRFLVGEALDGRATVGDVVMLLVLASQVNAQLGSVAGSVTWGLNSLKVAGRFVWLMSYAREAARRTLEPAAVPERLERGITLENVSFAYPGTDKLALTDISLHLPAGCTVAIVGENGAGKSTLVKLLCRLYNPTTGRVLVDGVDARRFDVDAWRERMSAAFQDWAYFMLRARQSVGVGELERVEDDSAVRAALERASATDVVATLPRGLDQQLGRYFKDGMSLSVGQWQKIALGRAMMREAPLLLVLDEPTASLDAPSEHALFERYAGAAQRAAASNGGITLLVSHRFSTVRMADLIVVLDKGHLAACGSHEALMTHGGLYAELYELQARAFRN